MSNNNIVEDLQKKVGDSVRIESISYVLESLNVRYIYKGVRCSAQGDTMIQVLDKIIVMKRFLDRQEWSLRNKEEEQDESYDAMKKETIKQAHDLEALKDITKKLNAELTDFKVSYARHTIYASKKDCVGVHAIYFDKKTKISENKDEIYSFVLGALQSNRIDLSGLKFLG